MDSTGIRRDIQRVLQAGDKTRAEILSECGVPAGYARYEYNDALQRWVMDGIVSMYDVEGSVPHYHWRG